MTNRVTAWMRAFAGITNGVDMYDAWYQITFASRSFAIAA